MPDLDNEQRPSRRLWILAAAGALALHLGGGALALAHLRNSEAEEYLGAQGIEIGLELTSARNEATDLPPGPDTDASVASPAIAEQKAELKETELPKDRPTEADDPDRVVTPNDSKKPKEEDTKIAAVQTSASEESVAQEATARQTIEGAREDDNPTVRHQGIGKDDKKLRAEWNGQLSAYLNLHKRYPTVRDIKATKVKVNFVLDRLGHVVSLRVVEGSGDPVYDEAALAMIRRSDPVPRPPPTVADEGLDFTLDVIFNKGKS
jgi:periplasmic protein TonB